MSAYKLIKEGKTINTYQSYLLSGRIGIVKASKYPVIGGPLSGTFKTWIDMSIAGCDKEYASFNRAGSWASNHKQIFVHKELINQCS